MKATVKSLESLLLVRRIIRRNRSKKAVESIERLFAEPFEPQYIYTRRREADYEAAKLAKQFNNANRELKDFIKKTEQQYRLGAVRSMARILAKVDDGCNYSNSA